MVARCGIRRPLEAQALARPRRGQLVNVLGGTAFLGVIDDAERVYIDKIGGRRTVRMYADIGARRPLHCTGIGKALLAHLARSEIDRIIAAKPLTRYTHSTITDPDVLSQEH